MRYQFFSHMISILRYRFTYLNYSTCIYIWLGGDLLIHRESKSWPIRRRSVGSSKSLRRGLSGDLRGFAQNLRGSKGFSPGCVPTNPVLSGGSSTAPLLLHLATLPSINTTTRATDILCRHPVLLFICQQRKVHISRGPIF